MSSPSQDRHALSTIETELYISKCSSPASRLTSCRLYLATVKSRLSYWTRCLSTREPFHYMAYVRRHREGRVHDSRSQTGDWTVDLYSTTQYNLQRGSILFILEGCEGVQTLRGCRRMKSLQWVGCTRGDCAIEFSTCIRPFVVDSGRVRG